MLLQPRDNNSILSTTPFPSDAQSFINYFNKEKEKEPKSTESGDSDMNLSDRTKTTIPALSHYSSLPQVYLSVAGNRHPAPSASPNPNSYDPKRKVMAELKQRIPPTTKIPEAYKLKTDPSQGSPSPPFPLIPTPASSTSTNQSLHTQHHHYYRIPSPCLSYSSHANYFNPIQGTTVNGEVGIGIGQFPSAKLSNLSIIPEESESLKSANENHSTTESSSTIGNYSQSQTQTTLSFPTEHINPDNCHPTIFEVFGADYPNGLVSAEADNPVTDQVVENRISNQLEFSKSNCNLENTCTIDHIEAPTENTPTILTVDFHTHTAPGTDDIIDGASGTLGPQDNLLETNENKIEPEPLEALLYFNV